MSRFVEIEEGEEDEDEDVDVRTVSKGKTKRVLPPLQSTSQALLQEVEGESEEEDADAEADVNDPEEELLPAPSTSTSRSPSLPPPVDPSQFKGWQMLYPIYIDSERPYKSGCRRTPRRQGMAVPHPNAKEMAEAGSRLGLRVVYEPGKTHPRDWENPGRVRVLLRENGRSRHPTIKNKDQLLRAIAAFISTSRPPLHLYPPLSTPRRRRDRIIYTKTLEKEIPERTYTLPEYSPALIGTAAGEDGQGRPIMPPGMEGSAFGGLGAMLGGLAGGDDDEDEGEDDKKVSKRAEKMKSKGKKKRVMVRG